MISLICGLVALALGVYGMAQWREALWQSLKGLGPLSLALAGIVTIVVAIIGLTPSRRPNRLDKNA